jgi:hypothetical protein
LHFASARVNVSHNFCPIDADQIYRPGNIDLLILSFCEVSTK